MKDVYEKERILDEMPQSGTGKTITTTEPKFIPADAVQLDIEDGLNLKVRLVDCVGYIVPGSGRVYGRRSGKNGKYSVG